MHLVEGLTNYEITAMVAGTSTVLAGTTGGSVFSRKNSDSAWTEGGDAFAHNYINALAVGRQVLLAAPSAFGAYYSTDNGVNWRAGAGMIEDLAGTIIVGFEAGTATLYAASDGKGVFRSVDNGRSWTKQNQGLPNLNVHSVILSDSALFAATEQGVCMWADSQWISRNSGLGNQTVSDFSRSGTALLAGTVSGGVYITTDGGLSWRPANQGLPVSTVRKVVTDGVDVYAGTDLGGVCRRPLAEMTATLGVQASGPLPSGFRLLQNFPNPFNPSTTITFTLPSAGIIRLSVFDLLGREVALLAGGRMGAGTHRVEWHPAGASGVYFYRLEVRSEDGREAQFSETRRMIVLR